MVDNSDDLTEMLLELNKRVITENSNVKDIIMQLCVIVVKEATLISDLKKDVDDLKQNHQVTK